MDRMLMLAEDLAQAGVADVKAYFSSRTRDDQSDGHGSAERADKAIKLLSAYSRVRATRANEMGVILGMAKMMGLRGEALMPMWGSLTGTDASKFLPAPQREQSGGDEKAVAARKPTRARRSTKS